jgi:hypothetical protein
VSITKVVVFCTKNPTKLSLQFSEFSTIFYAFYKFLQTANTIEVSFCAEALEVSADSQPYPYFTQNSPEKLQTLQCRPRAPTGGSPAKFRRTGGQDRPGAGEGGPEGSGGLISAGVRSGGGAGGVAQQRRPVVSL